MAKKNLNALNIVNVINKQINHSYNTTLPAVTKASFRDMAKELRIAPDVVRNDWHNSLINLVGLQMAMNKRQFRSYFRELTGREIDTFDVQMLMMDLLEMKAYKPDANADDYFEDVKPEIAAQYAHLNFQGVIPVSLNEESLYGAFISESAFMDYMEMIERTLYSTLEMSDVQLVKELVNQNIKEGNIRLYPIEKPVDRDTALAFTEAVKATLADMEVEMSREYNLAGIATFTPREDDVIISGTDVKATTETYSLAWAFNKNFIDLENEGRAITAKSDAFAGGSVYALAGDKFAFQIHPVVGFPKVTTQYFGNTLTQKRWLHYWAMYIMSYFNNMIAFAKPGDVEITSATLATRSGSDAMNRGEKGQIFVDNIVVPEGKIADKFGCFELAGNNSPDTVIDADSGKIRIARDETAAKVTVTWTSHLAEGITAQKTITING